ncbi:hypothetical protein T492DRAFT_894216, partial [Pavlovales sp. CCMP2436]
HSAAPSPARSNIGASISAVASLASFDGYGYDASNASEAPSPGAPPVLNAAAFAAAGVAPPGSGQSAKYKMNMQMPAMPKFTALRPEVGPMGCGRAWCLPVVLPERAMPPLRRAGAAVAPSASAMHRMLRATGSGVLGAVVLVLAQTREPISAMPRRDTPPPGLAPPAQRPPDHGLASVAVGFCGGLGGGSAAGSAAAGLWTGLMLAGVAHQARHIAFEACRCGRCALEFAWVGGRSGGSSEEKGTRLAYEACDGPPGLLPFEKRLMAEGAPSGHRPGRASARLVACAEAALPPLLRYLAGDPLHAVAKLLADAGLSCFRLACKAFHDHSSPAQERHRAAFLRTQALVVFAWTSMPGFVLYLPIMLCFAASVGCVDVLEELVDNRQCALTAGACTAAAGEGQLGALGWLRSRGWHLETLRYAHEHGCPWDTLTCYYAALGGHLEVLRYAHEHSCPWKSDTTMVAGARGHLEVLRYAHEHGCPWNWRTCCFAARGGHLEVLRYAHEHGCPWDSATSYGAAQGGHLEVLRYAHEHGCPVSLEDLEICRAEALTRGHAEVVEYLQSAQPNA